MKKYIYNIDLVRQRLINILANYQGYTGEDVIIVFDSSSKIDIDYVRNMASNGDEIPKNIKVVYAPSEKGADIVIEEMVNSYQNAEGVRVVTGDALERMAVVRTGAVCVSPERFEEEVNKVINK